MGGGLLKLPGRAQPRRAGAHSPARVACPSGTCFRCRLAATAAPEITRWLIPFAPKRKRQMAAYSERHYGERTWRLRHPHVIVEHFAEAGTAAAVYNTFAPDVARSRAARAAQRLRPLRRLLLRAHLPAGQPEDPLPPHRRAQLDRDRDRAHRLQRRRRARRPPQLHASLQLTRYLRCRFHIRLRDVIGHAESLSSPYHRERRRRACATRLTATGATARCGSTGAS